LTISAGDGAQPRSGAPVVFTRFAGGKPRKAA